LAERLDVTHTRNTQPDGRPVAAEAYEVVEEDKRPDGP
jgi:hypothetical protein